MKNIFYCLILLLFACKTQDISPKHVDLSEREYNQYCTMLKDARAKKDYFNEGTALCNLKQPSKKVYKLLQKSIKNVDTLCYKIHEYQDNNINSGFQVSIIKIDTIRWGKLCKECEKIVPLENYYIKKSKNELAYKKKMAIAKGKLDTTLIDKKMVDLLSEIIEKDQRIRGLVNQREVVLRWQEQKELDSLNLHQIDAIFKSEGGYPSLQKVGYDQVLTPWYVLQHQPSAEVRRKYLPILEEAVKKGLSKNLFDNYLERTITIEENKKLIRP
jgi:hypothetical protein